MLFGLLGRCDWRGRQLIYYFIEYFLKLDGLVVGEVKNVVVQVVLALFSMSGPFLLLVLYEFLASLVELSRD